METKSNEDEKEGTVSGHLERGVSCPQCGNPKAYFEPQNNDVCVKCIRENRHNQSQQVYLINHGHTLHCAARQVHGDGECECGKGN